jgi:hypothetical protein
MKAHQRFIREELSKTEPSFKADIATAVVHEITSSQAKEIIEKYEWLKTMPAVVLHCYGIFFDGICGGAVVFGQEYGENLGIWDKLGYTGKIITLARGCSAHWAHPHSASKLIRTSMKMLPEKFKVVTATVDETAGEGRSIRRRIFRSAACSPRATRRRSSSLTASAFQTGKHFDSTAPGASDLCGKWAWMYGPLPGRADTSHSWEASENNEKIESRSST